MIETPQKACRVLSFSASVANFFLREIIFFRRDTAKVLLGLELLSLCVHLQFVGG
jgi:hypothetical protein